MNCRIYRRDVLAGIGAAGAAGLAGCAEDDPDGSGDGADTPEPDDDDAGMDDDQEDVADAAREIKLGLLMAETGDLGPLGPMIRDAALLAVDQVNDSDAGFDIDVQVGDTQSDPQAGLSEASSLIGAGYPAVVGPLISQVNMQVATQEFIPNGIVGMSPSSTAPDVTDLDDNGYIFRTAPSDLLQGEVMADLASERLESSTVSTLFLNDDYGQALADVFTDAFEERGGDVLNEVSIESEQASYSSQWADALDGDPDAVMVVAFPQSGIQLFRDYYNEFADDHDPDIIIPDGLRTGDLPDEVDNPMEDVIGTSPESDGPGVEFFEEQYQEAYDEPPGAFTGQTYDAAAVLMLANAAAGENDGEAIRDAVREVANPGGTEITPENLPEGLEMAADGEEIQYSGASSSVNFDENGDMESVFYEIFRFDPEEGIEQIDLLES